MSTCARYRREIRDRWLAMRLGLTGRQHQYGEIVALRRFVAHFDIDCVIDVGANAGQYATMLRKDVGFWGAILSFEPNPDVCATLETMAARDSNWHVYNIALSDRDGEAEFNIMAADQFSSLNAPGEGLEAIFAQRNRVARTVHVPCARLDSLLPDLEPARAARAILLKMDTQGHDAQVCAGASRVLGDMVGVQTELAVRSLYAGATDYRTMIALMERAGFVPNAMFANNKGHFPLLVELDGLFVRSDLTRDGNVPSSDRPLGRPLALVVAIGLGAVLALGLSLGGWLVHIDGHRFRGVAEYFFARQDMWVLDAQALLLLLLAGWLWTIRGRTSPSAAADAALPDRLILVGIALAIVVAWLGRSWVFHGYSPSRDEVMVEMASAYLADGHVGWAIPADWQTFRHAIVPEFYSPYGSDTHWTAIYLPVHAAIRALFVRLGDADLAAPLTLGVGLLALWHNAGKLMPARRDAVVVVMVMALTSAQLVATAMTPYAMTSHFAFNMVWLALVLREDRIGHVGAGIVALLAAGLHQWHFPLLFIGPFILWMLARRRWGAAGFHVLVALAMMILWARLWPMLLTDLVGAPPPTDAHRTNGIVDKLQSLFGRLDSWQPLLNNARLVSWNNLLLLPLAGLALCGVRWRGLLRPLSMKPSVPLPITLPLALGVVAGMGLALYQGYGWGFRYMHGQIGALCLLAGLGWQAVVPQGERRWLLAASAAIALLSGLWLVQDSEHYVRGYARTMDAIRHAPADVVLVDIRGGYYMTDLVRFDEGRPVRPVVMALQMLTSAQLDQLCAAKRVAIMDRAQFWGLGVHPVPPFFRGSDYIQHLRDHLAAQGCGRPVTP